MTRLRPLLSVGRLFTASCQQEVGKPLLTISAKPPELNDRGDPADEDHGSAMSGITVSTITVP